MGRPAGATGPAPRGTRFDVVIVGSGPNGLAAAVLFCRAGLRVAVFEAADEAGGGARTTTAMGAEVWHDVCSAVHPMAMASPFFRAFDLAARGVALRQPQVAYAHPLDGGRAGIAWADLDRTVESLGAAGPLWRRVFAPLLARWEQVVHATLSDLRDPSVVSLAAVRFAARVGALGQRFVPSQLHDTLAGDLLAGVNMHAVARPDSLAATGVGVMLALLAHAVGWPIPVGGSRSIVRAMVTDIERHGGRVYVGHRVTDVRALPPATAVVMNVSPAVIARIAGEVLPHRYRQRLAGYRYGPGSCTLDLLLSAPVPWAAADCSRAGTLHLVGTRDEAIAAADAVRSGVPAPRPYVLAVQPGVVDGSRAPSGLHTLSAYCHVPHGSDADASGAMLGQLERFAPGVRDLIVDMRVRTARDVASHNESFVGGNITSGELTLLQTLRRPRPGVDPYTTPVAGLYHCSAASPPGPGVHGMAGLHVARRVLRRHFGITAHPLDLLRLPATAGPPAAQEGDRR